MLTGKRSARVGDQILREIALLLLRRVRDPRVRGVTVTGVRLSNDLKIARVYFSVMGEEEQIKRAQTGLESAKGFIKREIGRQLSLRYVPEIIFVHDASLEKGNHMDRIFEALRCKESNKAPE